MLGFMVTTKPASERTDSLLCGYLIGLQYIGLMGLYLLVPFSYIAILMVIWSAQIRYYLPLKTTVVLSFFWSLPTYVIFHYYWQEPYMLLTAALYWMFNLFAVMTVNSTLQERQAKEQAMRLNSELMATQSLLGEAARQSERLHIARNIHDVVGHHLTALSINLQVAARKSEGESREQIEHCYGLSRLLLTDVREAVSDIRQHSAIDLQGAIKQLISHSPGLKVNFQYEKSLQLEDVKIATTLLRCVQEGLTNCMKHSNATEFDIVIVRKQKHICLTMQDNGQSQSEITKGNGLLGMSERVTGHHGKLSILVNELGVAITIRIPESEQ